MYIRIYNYALTQCNDVANHWRCFKWREIMAASALVWRIEHLADFNVVGSKTSSDTSLCKRLAEFNL